MKKKVIKRIEILKEINEFAKEFLVMVNRYYPGYAGHILTRMMALDNVTLCLNAFISKAQSINWEDDSDAVEGFNNEVTAFGDSLSDNMNEMFGSLDTILGTDNETPPEEVLRFTAEIVGKIAEKSTLLTFYNHYNL